MIKKICAVLCAAALTYGTVAFAQVNKPILDLSDETIFIDGYTPSGKAGRNVNIVILNPTETQISKSSVQFEKSVLTGENGYFGVSVKINPQLIKTDEDNIPLAGDFKVYVFGDDMDFDVEKYDKVFFAAEQTRQSIIDNYILKAKNETELAEFLEKYENELGIKSEAYNAVNKLSVAKVMLPRISELGLNAGNAQSVIFENSIVAAFNERKFNAVFANGDFIYPQQMGLTAYDAQSGGTLKELYDKDVAQKAKVAEAMLSGKIYKSAKDLQAEFACQTVLKAMEYPTENGYGYIDRIFTDKNAELSGLNIVGYKKLSAEKQASVKSTLAKKHFDTISLLQAALNSAVGSGSGGVTGGGANSSGNGGTGGSKISFTPIANTPDNGNASYGSFSDLNGFDWAKESIEELNKKNIISGVGDNKFAPEKTIKREELAKIICNAFEYRLTNADGRFSDVQKGSWYEKYVNTLLENGIVNGMTESLFGVGESVTRQDFAVIAYRALGNVDFEDKNISFDDSGEISDYALRAVKYFTSMGIINGYEDGTFRPKEPCTRAQAAKIIYSIIK